MVSQNSLNNQVLNNDFTVTHTNSGGNAFVSVANLSNTASSDATLIAGVAGTSAGDAKVNLNISGGQNWTLGLDNSDSDAFIVAASSALGTTNVIRASTSGAVSVVLGNFDVTRSASGSTVSGTVSNTSNTASSNATQFITVAGSSAGDVAVQYAVSGTTTWTEGIDNSDSDSYVLAASSALGTTNAFRISTAGAPTFPLSPLDVPSGGTTNTSFTAYSVVCGGTTSTGALQNVSGVGTSGQVLTSNGAGALPSWQAGGGGGGSLSTLTGNTGGAISPSAGNINTVGTGSITIAGSGSTLTTQLTGLTNHDVLIGQGTATIGLVAPSATTGIPLVSNGASADPSFSTAKVAGGGTGLTSLTTYALLAGGTTSTGNVQQVASLGNSGQVLTSNGAGALPTWQTNPNLNVTTVAMQVFTSNGTYTPTPGMRYCIVEVVGGGGGGGGCAANSAFSVSVGSGGGAGAYSKGVFSSVSIGASKAVTVGSGGAGASGTGTGGDGGTTSLGSLISVGGGHGGTDSGQITGSYTAIVGGAGGNVIINGSYFLLGQQGGYAFGSSQDINGTLIRSYLSGIGGSTPLGAGGVPNGGNTTGTSAFGYGAGGAGGTGSPGGGSTGGGTGFGGVCIITEFIET